MTSPEGRLRCGRPSAVRPCNPSSSDQFQLRRLSDSILPPGPAVLPSSNPRCRSLRIRFFRFPFFPLNSPFRSVALTSCVLVHMPASSRRVDEGMDNLSSLFLSARSACTSIPLVRTPRLIHLRFWSRILSSANLRARYVKSDFSFALGTGE